MTENKSLKATFSGIGASLFAFLGICCGGGACAAACGTVCIAPLASILGVSSAGFSAWMNHLLPLMTALSAVAFTIAYYGLYKPSKKACCDTGSEPCCDNDSTVGNTAYKTSWSKPVFWVGLLLTIGFYTHTIAKNMDTGLSNLESTSCCVSDMSGDATPSSCSISSPSCNPASCSTPNKESK